jgi:bile acid:Na+ symporter, BASS family
MGDDVLVRVVIPVVVVFCMTVVGLDLTLEDFRRVARHPRLVAVGVLGSVLGLPPLAVALGHVLALPPAVAEGMVLVAACPTAILSNLFRSGGPHAASVTTWGSGRARLGIADTGTLDWATRPLSSGSCQFARQWGSR